MKSLGLEGFGLLILLKTIASFVSMSSFGAGSTITYYIAETLNTGRNETQAVFSSLFLPVLLVLFVASIILLSTSDVVFGMFSSGDELQFNYTIAAIITAGISAMAITQGCYVAVFVAASQTYIANGYTVANHLTTNIAGIICALVTTNAIVTGAVYWIASALITAICATHLHAVKLIKCAGILGFKISYFKKMIKFQANMGVSTIISALYNPLNKILVGKYLGIAYVPLYELSVAMPFSLRGLFDRAIRALAPEITKLKPENRACFYEKLGKLLKITFLPLLLGWASLIYFIPGILKLWLGISFEPILTNTTRLMLVSIYLSIYATIAYYILLGYGLSKKVMVSYAIQSFTSIVLLIPLLHFQLITNFIQIISICAIATLSTSIYLILNCLFKIRKDSRQTYN